MFDNSFNEYLCSSKLSELSNAGAFVAALLNPDKGMRPIRRSELRFHHETTVFDEPFSTISSVLDAENYGILVCSEQEYRFFPRNEAAILLAQKLREGRIPSNPLREDVKLFLNGKNTFLIDG